MALVQMSNVRADLGTSNMPYLPIIQAFTHESETAFLQIDTDNFLRVAYDGGLSEPHKIAAKPVEQAAKEVLVQMPEWQRRH